MANDVGSLKVSSRANRSDLLRYGRAVVDSYNELLRVVETRVDPDTANLFARPQRLEDGTIAWFDPLGGTSATLFSSLPEKERVSIDYRLRNSMAALEGLFDDPHIGDLVLLSLNADDIDFVRVVDGRPVLVGWGGLPSATMTDAELGAHHALTFGPYLANLDAPINKDAPLAHLSDSRVSVGGFTRMLPASLYATLIAALVLLFLMLPGVLRLGGGRIVDEAVAARARDLQHQIDQRDQALRTDLCHINPNQIPRLSPQRSDGQRDTAPSTGGQSGPGNEAGRTPEYSLPVRPEITPVPNEVVPPAAAPRPEGTTLAQLLRSSTVLIVTEKATGTGFFVNPTHILTNRHVVAEGDSGRIVVGNTALGKVVPVERVAMSQTSQPGRPDYALLKLREGSSQYFLSLTTELPEQLQNVVAAGYPGIVLDSDANFTRLRRGELTAIPEVAMTNGAVTVIQNRQSVPVILHRASISPGNSGGPLADECGRGIGVNTFVQPADGAADRLNYSLGMTSAIDFLKANNVQPTLVPGACTTTTPRGTTPESPPGTRPPDSTVPRNSPPSAAPGPQGPSADTKPQAGGSGK